MEARALEGKVPEERRLNSRRYFLSRFSDEKIGHRWAQVLGLATGPALARYGAAQSSPFAIAGEEPLDLLIVMPSAQPWGGAEEALMQFCRHRGAARIAALTIFFLEPGELVEQVRALGCRAEVIEGGRLRQVRALVVAIRRLCGTIRHQSPDLILSWMTKAHIYAGVAGPLVKVPACYFQMGLPDGGVVDRLSRLIPAQGAVGCSSFVANQQRRLVRHPVEAVPLAADLERFDRNRLESPTVLKKRLGFEPARPLVGIVGRLQHWKGMHVFLEAMAQVIKTCPEAEGVIVGGVHYLEPEYPVFLQAQLAQWGLVGRVRLVGTQSNIPEWMQAMDVVVHASHSEPFGIVVIEAMALGKPVVASIPGGPSEVVTNEVDGLLVKSGDAKALARAISRFLREPDLAASCGAQAVLRARDFSPEDYSRRLGVAMRRLLSSSVLLPPPAT
jgi:glycosyltransferase involved in cell wall biosynthesis